MNESFSNVLQIQPLSHKSVFVYLRMMSDASGTGSLKEVSCNGHQHPISMMNFTRQNDIFYSIHRKHEETCVSCYIM